MSPEQLEELISKITAGRAGIMPTDTIYGIVASVKFPETIERIYELTGRPAGKPFIVLVSSLSQLDDLKIKTNQAQRQTLGRLWPGPVSAILPSPYDEMKYIHRGKRSIAVRLPDLAWLQQLVTKTGPIVATSANRSGEPTPDSIDEIKQSLSGFDFYVGGPTSTDPSRLVGIGTDGSLAWIER